MRSKYALTTGLIMLALAGVGCGDSADESAPGDKARGAEIADSIDLATVADASGEITYCTGKDTSGDLVAGVERFNAQRNGVTVEILEFPESADEQRNQFIQRQRAESDECDVFEADVVWTAEFASQGWLMDLTEYVESREAEFIPSTLETVRFEDRAWGVPRVTDAGLLYYRTDQVEKLPATWQDVYAAAAEHDGIAYQGASYEGLTVNFLELAFAAGGQVLSEDGSQSMIDSPENLQALEFMVDGIESGAALKGVTTFMEEPARRAFEAGRATFMRNWPYAFALGKQAPKVKDQLAVAPYPEFAGGGRAAILGGHNMVVSAHSKHQAAALKLIEYFTSAETMKINAVEYSKAPVLAETYEDPDVQEAMPFASELRRAVEQAKSRPVSPVYSLISQAIYENVNAALSGKVTPDAALKKADAGIQEALATF